MPGISKTEQLMATARFSFGCLSFWDLSNPRIKEINSSNKKGQHINVEIIVISADYASDGGSTDQNLS